MRGNRALFAILILGFLLFLPAVRAPFFLDDYLHIAMLEGTFPGSRSPLDLYDFVDDGNRAAMLERGLLPWWTQPDLRIRFFRPLASGLAWADHHLFGHQALPMHLHSLAWWLLAVLAAHRLYARLFAQSRRTVLFATAIFALAPCHALPLAWLANRETLIALAFGITGLDAHARFREGGRAKDALVAALFFLLALLGGGEYATAFGGYVLAIEMMRKGPRPLRRGQDGDSLVKRIVGMLPFAVPAMAYLAVRAHLGYGTSGSGFYTDPLRDPLAFLAHVPWRAVALLAEGWLTYDVSTFVPGTSRWLLALVVAAIVVFLQASIRRAIGALPEGPRRSAWWLLVGSLVAMAPVLAVVPAMRVLGACMLGIAPVVAIVVEQAWFADAGAEETRAVQLGWYAALLLGFAHLVHGPGGSFVASRRHRSDALDFRTHAGHVREMIGDPSTADVVIVRGMAAASFFMPFALDPRGAPPARWCVLSHTGHELFLRKDERTFELISATTSGLYPIGDGNLFRSERAPLRAGAEARTGCLQASVLEVGDHGVRRARIDLRPELTRPVYVEEDFDDWKPAELPPIGFGAPFDP